MPGRGLALVARILLVSAAWSCGRIEYAPGSIDGSAPLDAPEVSDSGSDAAGADASIPCEVFGPWGPPTLVVGLSSDADDSGAQLTADGLAIYFHTYLAAVGGLWVARRAVPRGDFGTPAMIDELDGSAPGGEPAITGDEREIFFSRYTESASLYTATRADRSATWGPITRLDVLGSSGADGSFLTPDGLTLYYDDRQANDIYVTTRTDRSVPFAAGTVLTALRGTGTRDMAPSLSLDQRTIYFASDRVAANGFDVYSSTRATPSSPFDPPAPVDGINGPGYDGSPTIGPDGLELYFSSDRGESGTMDIYLATRTCMR